MSNEDLTRKAERALVTVGLGTAALIIFASLMVIR